MNSSNVVIDENIVGIGARLLLQVECKLRLWAKDETMCRASKVKSPELVALLDMLAFVHCNFIR